MKNNNMAKIALRLLAAALIWVALPACGDDADTNDIEKEVEITLKFSSADPEVEISADGRTASLEIPSLGGSISLDVDTNADWTIDVVTGTEGEWLSINGVEGKLIVAGPEFTSDYVRRTMIRIMNGDKPIGHVNVSQAGTEVATLVLDQSDIVFGEIGGTATINVETNRESWHVENFNGNGWLEYGIDGDKITLNAATNQVPYVFETEFTVVAGSEDNSKAKQVKVTLESWSPAYLVPDRKTGVLPQEGGVLNIKIDSNREWKVSSEETWFTVEKEDGTVILNASPSSSGTLEGSIRLETTSGKDPMSVTLPIRQYTNPYTLEYTVPADDTDVAIPIGGEVNCFVDWGDGTSTNFAGTIEIGMSREVSHKYSKKGIYNVKIYGTAAKLTVGYGDIIQSSTVFITAVKNWGDLGAKDLQYMLKNTSIETIPDGYQELFKSATSLSGVFWDCKQLKELPADLLNNIQAESLSACFYGCVKLTTIPETLLKGASKLKYLNTMFRNCTGLTSLPTGLFKNSPLLEDFTATFAGCTSLTTLPADLFAPCVNAKNMIFVFQDCTSLTGIPTGLFDKCKKVTNFTRSFSGCSSLLGSSPYTEVSDNRVHLYERDTSNGFSVPVGEKCFFGCTGLEDYADIPAFWK